VNFSNVHIDVHRLKGLSDKGLVNVVNIVNVFRGWKDEELGIGSFKLESGWRGRENVHDVHKLG
jgi:hypothetical protein